MNVSIENDFRYCRDLTRRSATSFYSAFRLLPAARRDALYAVYAFCRAVDDAVDDADPCDAPRAIAGWREELERCYRGAPTHPITSAIAASLERFPIPRAALGAILEGVEMDLTRARYETFAELEVYCRRVASAVGLAAIEIFGYRSPLTREYAVRLGIALQLTNILRDVSEDAARGRVYLPEEDLARFDYPAGDLFLGIYNRRFRSLMEFECERARSYYRGAEAVLAPVDVPRLRSAELMRRTYEEVLDRIVAEDYDVFGRRLGVPRRRKAWLAAAFWAEALFRA
ncbi:MAG: 15-cis-phytoene synthase [Candidatus Binatota bacterium]|jgi:phytoene synthase|nr:15-cis-phytoene synthase [Candidatus Binatota bacterium]